MQNASAVVGVIGTALVIVVPLLMLGYILFLFGPRSRAVLWGEGRSLSIRMVVNHFAGFALFVTANAIPISLMPVRVIAAVFGILLLGIVPAVVCTSLIKRRLLPKTLYPFGWFVAGATGLLSVLLGYAVWTAVLAVKVTSG